MPSIAIVDSGPLVASANPRDPDHEVALKALPTPGLKLVITFDHCHFRVVRPSHVDAFRLLPATLA